MHDLICDCPFRLGMGDCDLSLVLQGERKYPKGCPKRLDKVSLKNTKGTLTDI